ncbi:MAG: hypothetical protein K6G45_07170 [Lachnospiraceae bacterium]|nr:hypothetical protein [Lachnospiraceae bacterium]MCR5768252.1 hypothetical protein [Lachnospiraceae bacterium]
MKKRILAYLQRIDELLQHPENVDNWQAEIDKHLTQIGFFMHERLIHLIVTALFAVLTFMVLIQLLNSFSVTVAVLFVALMVLLVPYILHYYLLENSVQKMYEQYDKMLEFKEKT